MRSRKRSSAEIGAYGALLPSNSLDTAGGMLYSLCPVALCQPTTTFQPSTRSSCTLRSNRFKSQGAADRPDKESAMLMQGRLQIIAARQGQGIRQLSLPQAQREIATGPFQHPSEGIGGAAKTAGDGVWEVDCKQVGVHVVHQLENTLRLVHVLLPPAPDDVEDVPAHFAGGFSQSVQVWRRFHAQRLRARYVDVLDHGRDEVSLRELLLCILYVAGPVDIRMLGEVVLGSDHHLPT